MMESLKMWFSVVKNEDPNERAGNWLFDVMKERGWEQVATNWILRFDRLDGYGGTPINAEDDEFGPVVIVPTVTDYPNLFTEGLDVSAIKNARKEDLLNINPNSWCILHHSGWQIPHDEIVNDMRSDRVLGQSASLCIYPYYDINYKKQIAKWPEWVNPAVKQIAQNLDGDLFGKLCLNLNMGASIKFGEAPIGDGYVAAVLGLTDEDAHNTLMDEVETTNVQHDEGYIANESRTVTFIMPTGSSYMIDSAFSNFYKDVVNVIVSESTSPTLSAYKIRQQGKSMTDGLKIMLKEIKPFMMTNVPLGLFNQGDGITLYNADNKSTDTSRQRFLKEQEIHSQIQTLKQVDASTGQSFTLLQPSYVRNGTVEDYPPPGLDAWNLHYEGIRENLQKIEHFKSYDINDIDNLLDEIDDWKNDVLGYDVFIEQNERRWLAYNHRIYRAWMDLYSAFIDSMTMEEIETFMDFMAGYEDKRDIIDLYTSFWIFTEEFAENYLNRTPFKDSGGELVEAIEYINTHPRLNALRQMDNMKMWAKYLREKKQIDEEGGWLNE